MVVRQSSELITWVRFPLSALMGLFPCPCSCSPVWSKASRLHRGYRRFESYWEHCAHDIMGIMVSSHSWSSALVLKTSMGHTIEGSNPSLTASCTHIMYTNHCPLVSRQDKSFWYSEAWFDSTVGSLFHSVMGWNHMLP